MSALPTWIQPAVNHTLPNKLRDISSTDSGVKTKILGVEKSLQFAALPQGLTPLPRGRKCLHSCPAALTACQASVRKYEDGARCDSRWRDPVLLHKSHASAKGKKQEVVHPLCGHRTAHCWLRRIVIALTPLLCRKAEWIGCLTSRIAGDWTDSFYYHSSLNFYVAFVTKLDLSQLWR